jgi:hypothetical protein
MFGRGKYLRVAFAVLTRQWTQYASMDALIIRLSIVGEENTRHSPVLYIARLRCVNEWTNECQTWFQLRL